MSRRPEDLSIQMYPLYIKWVQQMIEAGIEFIVTCTGRTQEEQEALYAIGRTVDLDHPKVTWTLHSKHLTGDAFDFVIMWNGKPDWNMKQKDLWQKAVDIGKSLGLSQVIGKDGRVKEYAHLQKG